MDEEAGATVEDLGVAPASAVDERQLEPEDRLYIEELVRGNHQEVFWAGWVLLYTKSNAASKKERMLVVSNFRIYTVKHGVLGARSTRQSYPLLDLEVLRASPADERRVDLVFAGNDLSVQSSSVVEIAQAVMFAFATLTYGVPKALRPRVELPPRFHAGYDAPRPDTQDGLLARYLAACDYLESPPRLPVLDYFMASFETGDRTLDVRECLALVKQPALADVQAIANALANTDWYTEVVSADFPLRDEGVAALSACVAPHLVRLELTGAKASRQGAGTLADRLRVTSLGGLRHLSLSGNPIGDAGARVLVDALLEAGASRTLERLQLAGCGLQAKGVQQVCGRLLRDNDAWRTGLRALDLSDNAPGGKSGSLAVCEWLQRAEGLRQVDLMRCSGLAVDAVLSALGENEPVANESLEGLNLSGNKLGKTAGPLLARLLRQSRTLSHLYLVDCSMSREAAVEVLRAALDNRRGVRYWIEMSGNDAGPKGAKALADLMHRRRADGLENVHALVLNSCSFGAEGVTALADSLSGSRVHTLSLDNNIRTGLFGDEQQAALWAGESLARMVVSSPSLRELSLAGDDSHYLRSAAFPVLRAVGEEACALEYLDVSRNRLGDEGVGILAASLRKNRRLVSFTAERNRMGLEGLRELHRAVLVNETLQDWAVPRTDVQNILRGAQSKVVKELRAMMYDFDMAMDRNTRAALAAAAGDDGADPVGVTAADVAGAGPTDEESPRRNRRASQQMLDELEAEELLRAKKAAAGEAAPSAGGSSAAE